MTHDIQHLINVYFKKKLEGMDITAIRKELEAMQVPNEDIRYIILKIDDLVVEEELKRMATQRKKEFNTLGTVFLFIGLLLLLLKYLGLLNLHGYYVLIYAPIIVGGIMIWRARDMDTEPKGLKRRPDKRIKFR